MTENSYTPVKLYKRRWIVNYQVQFILIAYSLFLTFAVIASQLLLHLLALQNENLGPESVTVLRILIYVAVTILFLIILFYGFNLTNRIVGPIFRLKEHMDSINQGKTPKPFSVRKNDYFKEIVAPYNKLIEKINSDTTPST